jgi:hypothetical protein
MVTEKIDGQLATLYHYSGNWHVSSSGTPDGAAIVGAQGLTFADLFWRVWRAKGYQLPLLTELVYCFELFSPLLPVVVPPRDPQGTLYLHGVRVRTALPAQQLAGSVPSGLGRVEAHTEIDPAPVAAAYRWAMAPHRPDLLSLEAVLAEAYALDPSLHVSRCFADWH